MKKTYLTPSTKVIRMRMTHFVCTSIKSNVSLRGGGETPYDFDEDDIR